MYVCMYIYIYMYNIYIYAYVFLHIWYAYTSISIERLTVSPDILIFITYISMNEGNDTYVFFK